MQKVRLHVTHRNTYKYQGNGILKCIKIWGRSLPLFALFTLLLFVPRHLLVP